MDHHSWLGSHLFELYGGFKNGRHWFEGGSLTAEKNSAHLAHKCGSPGLEIEHYSSAYLNRSKHCNTGWGSYVLCCRMP